MTGELDMLEIRSDPAELSRMREFVWAQADRCGLEEGARFQAQLVATEAVTNAIRHGQPDNEEERPIAVRCSAGDEGFTIEVGDRGRFRHREPSPLEGTGGRGLVLIERFTSRFALETSEEGTTLTMLVDQAA
jgi:serine/threonine-protein kinase RsbW